MSAFALKLKKNSLCSKHGIRDSMAMMATRRACSTLTEASYSSFPPSYENDNSPTPLASPRQAARVNQTGLKNTPARRGHLKLAQSLNGTLTGEGSRKMKVPGSHVNAPMSLLKKALEMRGRGRGKSPSAGVDRVWLTLKCFSCPLKSGKFPPETVHRERWHDGSLHSKESRERQKRLFT